MVASITEDSRLEALRKGMSVLILTPDDVAAQSLGSALERRGINHFRHTHTLPKDAPLVLVLDVACPFYQSDLAEIQARAPWSRCYLIAEKGAAPNAPTVPTIQKPFDAPAIAELLAREAELAELELRRRRLATRAKELGLLLQSSFEAIIGLDASGKIVFWNQGAQRTYGYSESEALGQGLNLLGGDCPSEKNEPHAPREAIRRHKHGHEVLVLISRSPAGERLQNTLIAWAEVSLDITDKRALEREVEHGQRLAQLGRMAATLSHEVNNPLAVIRSNAAWLSAISRQAEDKEMQEVAADLELASERIATFVDLMTGFARRGAAQLEYQPLTKSLSLALRMVRPRAESHRVELVQNTETSGGVAVPHDPTRFAHAVINVVSNAIDAATHGGSHVWLKLDADEDWLTVEVEDDGPGIASGAADRVFEPFYTTKPFGQGTGLGLWLTQQIIADHAGQITMSSREPTGTRVRLSLPRRRRSD